MPDWLTNLFGVQKPAIAMAHVPALPGTPRYDADGDSRPYLMHKYGLDAIALVGEVETLLGPSLTITEEDLQAVRLEPVHTDAKAEGL